MGWRDVLRKYGPAIVNAILGVNQPAPTPAPVVQFPTPEPVPVPPVPVAPPVAPVIDVVAKWKGTLDMLSVRTLGYPLTDPREIYDLCIHLEAGRIEEVQKDLDKKK